MSNPPPAQPHLSRSLPAQSAGEMDEPALCAADQHALDSLIDAHLQVDPTGDHRHEHVARQRRVHELLSLLGTTGHNGQDAVSESRESLVALTMARVARQRQAERQDLEQLPTLSPNDRDAFEQLVAAEFDPQRVSAAMRPRAMQAARLLAHLEPPASLIDSDAAAPDRLVQMTMDRVAKAEREQRSRMSLAGTPGAEAEGSGRRFRLTDLVSVAALLLIATAVIGPMVSSVRGIGQRVACQSNMGSLASAFGLYAGDSRDSLPMASASLAGTPWWNVGKVQESNSANLFTLSRTGYTCLNTLACPTNARGVNCKSLPNDMDWSCLEEVSFSFQNLFARERASWGTSERVPSAGLGGGRVVVLVDRSPVVPLAVRGFRINPLDNSPSHKRMGQNVLFNDGSSAWLRSPVLESGDNIWLPRVIETMMERAGEADPLKGTESPDSRDDSFVGP